MKVYQGVIKKGKIAPTEPLDLPDGTIVQITLETKDEVFGTIEPDPFKNIEELAVETGVLDFAEEHNHYLYGPPKLRQERASDASRIPGYGCIDCVG